MLGEHSATPLPNPAQVLPCQSRSAACTGSVSHSPRGEGTIKDSSFRYNSAPMLGDPFRTQPYFPDPQLSPAFQIWIGEDWRVALPP